MTTYNVRTYTVTPTEFGFEWDVFGADRLTTSVEVRNETELLDALFKAADEHLERFPDAEAVKTSADPAPGERHVRRGRAICERPPFVRRSEASRVEWLAAIDGESVDA
jgi:hypothetical protein